MRLSPTQLHTRSVTKNTQYSFTLAINCFDKTWIAGCFKNWVEPLKRRVLKPFNSSIYSPLANSLQSSVECNHLKHLYSIETERRQSVLCVLAQPFHEIACCPSALRYRAGRNERSGASFECVPFIVSTTTKYTLTNWQLLPCVNSCMCAINIHEMIQGSARLALCTYIHSFQHSVPPSAWK